MSKAKVIYDRLVVFKEPGGTSYITLLHKGDVVTIVKGESYSDRDWKDKRFMQIMTSDGKIGYIAACAVTLKKGESK